MLDLQPWDFAAALALVRELERALSPVGWHVALGGSVLHKGESMKDVDVIVFPHDASCPSLAALEHGLVTAGLRRVRAAHELHAHWRRMGSQDIKHVETWAIGDSKTGVRRVDILVLK